ncbi:DNA repair helicase and transcription factor protein, putative [Trypanosoma cruzi]|uniref:DNA 3'-5' helicase n=1 Tax=Trypanosoma cruzi (strain CL Brener) TaxID=353153 RepID=Q4DHR0_TRYCC|nr:DNA repair helicase and transcription factor protein, putative [Trypanosoma cruzi]EAN92055.1 DNA repair helicase and transcription factor protein, putative [Trypanosoma cruzi]|eukprot:XP_813906.1 DNA repair helicase and transcription factor protein [Trypanosoma cruzi strain CL Brener]
MIVGANGSLFVNNTHPAYPHLVDFLTSCCEPVSRTLRMSEYVISPSSLSAASAEGTYSTAMIRNFIRYFRLDEQHRLPVDLAKLSALERQLENGEDVAMGTTHESEESQGKKQQKQEEDEDGLGPKRAKKENGERVSLVKQEATEETAAPSRRFFSLVKGVTIQPEPLISHALCFPDALRPLPPDLEQMLLEEERSSRVRIVLQPQLRSFQRQQPQHHSQGQIHHEDEGRLVYFLVSQDRQQMEFLVSRLQEFLVPVSLHGVMRWVLSDVDRGVEEKSVVESGRAKTLRRLFDTPSVSFASAMDDVGSCATAAANSTGRKYSRVVYKSQVKDGRLRNVRERLFKELGVRADLFYDYVQDGTLDVRDLALAEHVRLRPYQVASLERFRCGNKAHQGVIVLPCGAGKTLTGIGAATILKKRTIVMCINVISVLQWQREFFRWTDLSEDQVTVCISDKKQMPGDVFITTYSMLVAKRPTAPEQEQGEDARLTSRILASVEEQAWGLLLLDEVHAALAHHFQEVLNKVKYKCVVGLSATLLREDDKIGDLRHLVGPKLYEANWLELTRAGFLARVECAEVQCPLPLPFFREYLDSQAEEDPFARRGTSSLARAVVCFNPYKLWCTQALLEFHRNRSPPDKVIIFCDDLEGVQYYARHLNVPFMDGKTTEVERENLLQYFQHSNDINAIILSRVGDVALDIPCASVIIQVSGLGASRRQEAQRLGRILRPKPPSLDNTCSYFYTLVSQDTHEVQQSYGRQSWLRDQGFAYRVLQCDSLLKELRRTGGKPCCVGHPQWWYETLERKLPSAVAAKGSIWLPFSQEASRRMHRFFVNGREVCELDSTVLNDTPRTAELAVSGLGEKWIVRFSASNAPETFGTVQMAEDNPTLVRRICYGPLDAAHDCLKGEEECIQYILGQMRYRIKRRSNPR